MKTNKLKVLISILSINMAIISIVASYSSCYISSQTDAILPIHDWIREI